MRRMRSMDLDKMVIATVMIWLAATIVWMFWGSGFAFFAPAAHAINTTALLKLEPTRAEATALVERQGYLSIMQSRELADRARCRLNAAISCSK